MDAKTIDNRIRRAFNGIRQAFRGKIARVKAAGGVQKIQVEGLEGETVQDLEHAENFGFTSNPPAGSDCVVVPLGGKTSHGIIVTTTNGAYRITGLRYMCIQSQPTRNGLRRQICHTNSP